MTIVDRILLRCRQTDGCLIWSGCCGVNGYPKGNDRVIGNYDPRRVLFGAVPKGRVFLRASCGEKRCVAPGHQVVKTRKSASVEWNRSRSITHRLRTTEANRKRQNVKLTMDLARAIRARYAEVQNAAQVAREFGILHSHAHKICRNQAWAEVNPWAV